MAIIFSDVNIWSDAIGSADLNFNVNSIRASVFTILSTIRGERLFYPEFGSNIENLLFDPMDSILTNQLKSEILDSITKWDNRILVDSTNTTVSANFEAQRYDVVLAYSIPSLGIEESLTFNLSKRN